MYFIGIGLILLGLISLAVLFFSVSTERHQEEPGHIMPVVTRAPDLRDESVRPAPLAPVHPEDAPVSHSQAVAEPSAEPSPSILSHAAVRAVSPVAPAVSDFRPAAKRKDPGQLAVFGTLFLDHARNLSLLSSRGTEDLPPRMFSDFKRVGKGSLVCEGEGFFFKSGNSVHAYSTGDLEQIVFLSSGVALVPGSTQSPIAIFLTDESDRVKAFIRENAA
ncbi:MAG TPA: hypothetical protein PKE49_08445 [Leptospiraceae bacterium]|nr:hypothetical protein [Leptospirales bacterium]HMU84150.1 hypothetical protein [Leptospiraceae bacterium]HMW61644.1 hypothetical protein [Leptospiraceae bacterium]HMX56539.1 hypothetical protein [Leptospiraceae bacterium]HMY45657.1 hypothetical protein [Leptospiraceae bacterium]